jgi:hypothetical protein
MHHRLTERDIEKLKKSTANVFKLMHVLYSAFAAIISLFLGLFGMKDLGYFETAGITFLLLLVIYTSYFAIRYTSYRKDLSKLQKIAATIRVVKKSRKKTDMVIWADNPAIKRIELLNRKVFDLIEVGDEIYVEQTVYSKFLLRLEKQGKDLINDV